MINTNKLYTYFDRFHDGLEPSTNGWYVCECPYCGRRKMAVNIEYKQAKCFRGCFKGFAVDLIMDIQGLAYFEALEFVDEMGETKRYFETDEVITVLDIELPSGYRTILQNPESLLGDRARDYLTGRGFDLDYLDKIGVGYCVEHGKDIKNDFFGYIIIPFKVHGRLTYFIGRDYIGNTLRYKNPPKGTFGIGSGEVFFNEEALFTCSKIYLTEGWADAATMGKCGVSIQGLTTSSYQLLKLIPSPVKQVVVAMDAGYYKQGLLLGKDLMKYKEVRVLNLTKVEGGKDINEVGREAVLELENNTDPLTIINFYKELRKYR